MVGRAHSPILFCVRDSILPNVNKALTHSIFTSLCTLPLASHQKPNLQSPLAQELPYLLSLGLALLPVLLRLPLCCPFTLVFI